MFYFGKYGFFFLFLILLVVTIHSRSVHKENSVRYALLRNPNSVVRVIRFSIMEHKSRDNKILL